MYYPSNLNALNNTTFHEFSRHNPPTKHESHVVNQVGVNNIPSISSFSPTSSFSHDVIPLGDDRENLEIGDSPDDFPGDRAISALLKAAIIDNASLCISDKPLFIQKEIDISSMQTLLHTEDHCILLNMASWMDNIPFTFFLDESYLFKQCAYLLHDVHVKGSLDQKNFIAPAWQRAVLKMQAGIDDIKDLIPDERMIWNKEPVIYYDRHCFFHHDFQIEPFIQTFVSILFAAMDLAPYNDLKHTPSFIADAQTFIRRNLLNETETECGILLSLELPNGNSLRYFLSAKDKAFKGASFTKNALSLSLKPWLESGRQNCPIQEDASNVLIQSVLDSYTRTLRMVNSEQASHESFIESLMYQTFGSRYQNSEEESQLFSFITETIDSISEFPQVCEKIHRKFFDQPFYSAIVARLITVSVENQLFKNDPNMTKHIWNYLSEQKQEDKDLFGILFNAIQEHPDTVPAIWAATEALLVLQLSSSNRLKNTYVTSYLSKEGGKPALRYVNSNGFHFVKKLDLINSLNQLANLRPEVAEKIDSTLKKIQRHFWTYLNSFFPVTNTENPLIRYWNELAISPSDFANVVLRMKSSDIKLVKDLAIALEHISSVLPREDIVNHHLFQIQTRVDNLIPPFFPECFLPDILMPLPANNMEYVVDPIIRPAAPEPIAAPSRVGGANESQEDVCILQPLIRRKKTAAVQEIKQPTNEEEVQLPSYLTERFAPTPKQKPVSILKKAKTNLSQTKKTVQFSEIENVHILDSTQYLTPETSEEYPTRKSTSVSPSPKTTAPAAPKKGTSQPKKTAPAPAAAPKKILLRKPSAN